MYLLHVSHVAQFYLSLSLSTELTNQYVFQKGEAFWRYAFSGIHASLHASVLLETITKPLPHVASKAWKMLCNMFSSTQD